MSQNKLIYAGSYAGMEERGIHAYELVQRDGEQPELKEVFGGTGVSNPSYLAVSSDGDFLYSVMEDMTYEGQCGGGIAAFKRNGDSLTLLNMRGTGGTLPCHLLLDERRRFLFAANYMSGSVSMFRLNPDGSAGELCDFKQHDGHGPNEERQEGPHVHFLGFSADEAGILCVDLGIDRIKYYRIDESGARLIPEEEKDILFPDGVGPRHFTANCRQKEILYVVSELSSEIFVVDTRVKHGKILQRISTLPESAGNSTCAAIHLSEDGRFLYASNRGDDSIAVFAVDEASCLLQLVEITGTEGRTPRDFCLCGSVLLSANQDSNTVIVFQVQKESGTISSTGESVDCKAPVCLVTAPR